MVFASLKVTLLTVSTFKHFNLNNAYVQKFSVMFLGSL